MNRNLRNRPFIDLFEIVNAPIPHSVLDRLQKNVDALEDWFKGFEEDLLERQETIDKTWKGCKNSTSSFIDEIRGIKETD